MKQHILTVDKAEKKAVLLTKCSASDRKILDIVNNVFASIGDSSKALGKLAKKDPLKFIFGLTLLALLPLMVISTLHEVIFAPRASVISNPGAPSGQTLEFHSTYVVRHPSCAGRDTTTCSDGMYLATFINRHNFPIENIVITQFQAAGDRVSATFTDHQTSQFSSSVAKLNPGELLYIAYTVTPSAEPPPASISTSFTLVHSQCIDNDPLTTGCLSVRQRNSIVVPLIEIVAPPIKRPINWSPNHFSIKADSFAIYHNGKVYSGPANGSFNTTTALQNNNTEIEMSLSWVEHNQTVSLSFLAIKTQPDQWHFKRLTFREGANDPQPIDYTGMVFNINFPVAREMQLPGNLYHLFSSNLPIQEYIVFNNPSIKAFDFSSNPGNPPVPPTPPAQPAATDINSDGKTDLRDYSLFSTEYGKTGAPGFNRADIDRNGRVGQGDYQQLLDKLSKGFVQ